MGETKPTCDPIRQVLLETVPCAVAIAALDRAGGNKTQAARLLGLSRQGLLDGGAARLRHGLECG